MRITIGPNSQGPQRQIAKACIANTSDLAAVSGYVVAVRDDHGPDHAFYLPGHRRADGAWELVRRVCQVLGPGEPEADLDVPPTLDEVAQLLLAELKHP